MSLFSHPPRDDDDDATECCPSCLGALNNRSDLGHRCIGFQFEYRQLSSVLQSSTATGLGEEDPRSSSHNGLCVCSVGVSTELGRCEFVFMKMSTDNEKRTHRVLRVGL